MYQVSFNLTEKYSYEPLEPLLDLLLSATFSSALCSSPKICFSFSLVLSKFRSLKSPSRHFNHISNFFSKHVYALFSTSSEYLIWSTFLSEFIFLCVLMHFLPIGILKMLGDTTMTYIFALWMCIWFWSEHAKKKMKSVWAGITLLHGLES